jgi:hypothetical protein
VARAAVLVAVVVLAGAASAVQAASARDALLRPGVGIGKVRLGMTVAGVRRAMGKHDVGRAQRRDFGNRELELTWWSGLADSFVVRLLGPPGHERVISIATTRKSERTVSGIGPGIRVARFRRAFPNASCRTLFPVGGGTLIGTEFVVDAGNGRETAFVRGKWEGSTARPIRPELDYRNIVEVIVRTRLARPATEVERC